MHRDGSGVVAWVRRRTLQSFQLIVSDPEDEEDGAEDRHVTFAGADLEPRSHVRAPESTHDPPVRRRAYPLEPHPSRDYQVSGQGFRVSDQRTQAKRASHRLAASFFFLTTLGVGRFAGPPAPSTNGTRLAGRRAALAEPPTEYPQAAPPWEGPRAADEDLTAELDKVWSQEIGALEDEVFSDTLSDHDLPHGPSTGPGTPRPPTADEEGTPPLEVVKRWRLGVETICQVDASSVKQPLFMEWTRSRYEVGLEAELAKSQSLTEFETTRALEFHESNPPEGAEPEPAGLSQNERIDWIAARLNVSTEDFLYAVNYDLSHLDRFASLCVAEDDGSRLDPDQPPGVEAALEPLPILPEPPDRPAPAATVEGEPSEELPPHFARTFSFISMFKRVSHSTQAKPKRMRAHPATTRRTTQAPQHSILTLLAVTHHSRTGHAPSSTHGKPRPRPTPSAASVRFGKVEAPRSRAVTRSSSCPSTFTTAWSDATSTLRTMTLASSPPLTIARLITSHRTASKLRLSIRSVWRTTSATRSTRTRNSCTGCGMARTRKVNNRGVWRFAR